MSESTDLSILALSLGVALAATLVVVPLGIAVAWTVARWEGRGKVIVESLLTLPLVLPPTAVGIVLLMILAKDSLIGRLLESVGIDVVFTWKAAALAAAVMSFPLFVRS